MFFGSFSWVWDKTLPQPTINDDHDHDDGWTIKQQVILDSAHSARKGRINQNGTEKPRGKRDKRASAYSTAQVMQTAKGQNGTEKPRGERNKRAKIEMIVQVTKKMIEDKGYMETNTNRIAEAAGVSIGLVYKYFPYGKADIAHEISLRYHSPIADSIQHINMAEITKPDFREKLVHILLDWIEIHRRNVQFIRAMDIATLLHPCLHKGTAEMVRRTAEKGQPFLWPGEAPDSAELKELTLLLFHTVESVVLRHVTTMQVCNSDQQLAEFLADIVTGTILNRLRNPHSRHSKKT